MTTADASSQSFGLGGPIRTSAAPIAMRKLQTTARWTRNNGTTVLVESLLLPHGGAESLARGHGIVSVMRK